GVFANVIRHVNDRGRIVHTKHCLRMSSTTVWIWYFYNTNGNYHVLRDIQGAISQQLLNFIAADILLLPKVNLVTLIIRNWTLYKFVIHRLNLCRIRVNYILLSLTIRLICGHLHLVILEIVVGSRIRT